MKRSAAGLEKGIPDKVRGIYCLSHRFAFVGLLFLALVPAFFILSCGGGDGDDPSTGSGQEGDDAGDDTDNDSDDDLNDDIDDDDDDVDDDGPVLPVGLADDFTSPREIWCRSLGTVPPEPGWVWTEHLLGQWEFEDSIPKGYVTYSGDTLYALWGAHSISLGSRIGFLGRLEGDHWTQWQVEGPDDFIASIGGLVADSNGDIWSVLFVYDHEVYSTMCSIVR